MAVRKTAAVAWAHPGFHDHVSTQIHSLQENSRAVCVDDRATVCLQHAKLPQKGVRTCGNDEKTCRDAKDYAADRAKYGLLFSNLIHLKVSISQIEFAP